VGLSPLTDITPQSTATDVLLENFQVPLFLLPIYQAAAIQYDVPWQVLAAINEVETDYGRDLARSSKGAIGWMQFLPSTWRLYGVDATGAGIEDPYNPADAIFAAARYLQAAGAATDLPQAIEAYNHSTAYVQTVLLRAQLLGALPTDLVDALTELASGESPLPSAAATLAGPSTPALTTTSALGTSDSASTLYASADSPVVAVGDGRITAVGDSAQLGHYVVLRDVYGDSYTYGNLGEVASPPAGQVGRSQTISLAPPPAPAPVPAQPATAGASAPGAKLPADVKLVLDVPALTQVPARGEQGPAQPLLLRLNRLTARPPASTTPDSAIPATVDRLTARPSALTTSPGSESTRNVLAPGDEVTAGTVLGHLGGSGSTGYASLSFSIRPAGSQAPLIDPEPILASWSLRAATLRSAGDAASSAAAPNLGLPLLLSARQLRQRVLSDGHMRLPACERAAITRGVVDQRVLVVLEFLVSAGLDPTVGAASCSAPDRSPRGSWDGVDITALGATPVSGHQGAGSITDTAVRRLLTLQGFMRPTRIDSLMSYPSATNAISAPRYYDRVRVSFAPTRSGAGGAAGATLSSAQWQLLSRRLALLPNPAVVAGPTADTVADG
jgi:hypothetical protein